VGDLECDRSLGAINRTALLEQRVARRDSTIKTKPR